MDQEKLMQRIEDVPVEDEDDFDPDTCCPYCQQDPEEAACFYCQDGF